MNRRLVIAALFALFGSGIACSKSESPTSPTPDGPIFYTAIGASDGIGFGSSSPCIPFTDCPDAAEVGTVHQELVTQTQGVAGDLCLQQFDPVFDELAMNVVTNAEVACDWAIPPPPPGKSLDKEKINVKFTQTDGTVVDLGRIPPGEACDGREGWHYDDEAAPTTVISCPASCDRFRSGGGKVDVLFGCKTVVVQ
jgi:hypothetical protein